MKLSSRRVGGLLLVVLWAGGAAFLTGCKTPMQTAARTSLTPQEVEAIRAGQKAVVLFRITATGTVNENEDPLEYVDRVSWNIRDVSDWLEQRQLASPDRSTLHWRIPSEEAGRAGWRYLVLDPGRYFMEVIPDVGSDIHFPVYHVSIPRGPKLVYAGSFPFVLTNTAFGDFPGSRKIDWYYPEAPRDEIDKAREVGSILAPPLGGAISSLAVPNDLAAAVQPYPGRRIVAIEATTRSPQATKAVGQKAAFALSSPLAVPGLHLLLTGGNDPTFLSLIGLSLVIVASPLDLLGDLTFGSIARMNWAPHEAALNREIAEFNLAQHLTNSLHAELSGTNAAGLSETNAGAGFVVHLDVFRVGLGGVGGWQYAFTAGVHLSMAEAISNTVVWEHGFVYLCNGETQEEKHRGLLAIGDRSPDRLFREFPFVTFINSPTPASPLKAYKGQPGLRLVQRELEAAAVRLSEEMAARLGAAGF